MYYDGIAPSMKCIRSTVSAFFVLVVTRLVEDFQRSLCVLAVQWHVEFQKRCFPTWPRSLNSGPFCKQILLIITYFHLLLIWSATVKSLLEHCHILDSSRLFAYFAFRVFLRLSRYWFQHIWSYLVSQWYIAMRASSHTYCYHILYKRFDSDAYCVSRIIVEACSLHQVVWDSTVILVFKFY